MRKITALLISLSLIIIYASTTLAGDTDALGTGTPDTGKPVITATDAGETANGAKTAGDAETANDAKTTGDAENTGDAKTANGAETANSGPKVTLLVSKPDAEGYFTVKFTLYNATYKGILAYLSYNTETAVPVDFETLEPTLEFERFATIPTAAKDLDSGADIPDWLNSNGSKLSVDKGLIGLINVLNLKVAIPNSLITANKQILADENGLLIHEFYFKKVAGELGSGDAGLDTGDLGLNLKFEPQKGLASGLMVVNSSGAQTVAVEINYAEGMGQNDAFTATPERKTYVSNDSETSDDERAKRVKGRTNTVIFIQIGNYASVSNSYFQWIDDDNKNVIPYIKDERTMVPLRYLSEELGAVVTYYEDTEKISIKNNKTELILTVGEKEYTNDGLWKSMDVAAEVIDGRTFVPVRFVSEALDKAVHWVEEDQMAIITPKEYPWAEDNDIEKELYKNAQFLMSPMIRDLGHKPK
jgi:hypothetical protein